MERWKIENFTKTHGAPFPDFRSLSPEECRRVKRRVAAFLGEPDQDDGLVIIQRIDSMATQVDADPCPPSFRLSDFLKPQSGKVFVNWDRFACIDEIDLSSLDKFFSDIWYEGVDDIEVMDDAFTHFVLIRHWCKVKVLPASSKVPFSYASY
jgi:hypothetical protein